MKRRSIIVALVVLVIAGVVFLWTRKSDPLSFRLKIVRQTQEQGKPVVFFQVIGPRRPRIQITGIERLVRDVSESTFERESVWLSGRSPHPKLMNFWTPSLESAMGDPAKGRTEFAVQAPSIAPVWRLRVVIYRARPVRFKEMPNEWGDLRRRGFSLFAAAWAAWNGLYTGDSEVIESEPITNAILGEAFGRTPSTR